MSDNIIHSLYKEADDIIDQLNKSGEISSSSDARRHFTKIFILAAASYFEDQIQKILVSFAAKCSSNNKYLVSFIRNKAINLQYHTYFNWGEKNNPDKPGKNANTFFSLFGPEFKKMICDDIKDKSDIQESILCFIELGHMRNILVHSNFASYNNISKTLEEFYTLFNEANKFVIYLEKTLLSLDELSTKA